MQDIYKVVVNSKWKSRPLNRYGAPGEGGQGGSGEENPHCIQNQETRTVLTLMWGQGYKGHISWRKETDLWDKDFPYTAVRASDVWAQLGSWCWDG